MILRSLCLAFVVGVATPAFADGIEVHDPYVITAGVLAQTAAGFMVIHNHGTVADALLDVRSDAAAVVQVHLSQVSADGVMSMDHVTSPLVLAPEGALELSRGGYHVMFMGLSAPLADGDSVSVTLVFEQAGEVVVDMPVDLSRAGDMQGMAHD